MSIENTIEIKFHLLNNDNPDAQHEELTKCPKDCLGVLFVSFFFLQNYNANMKRKLHVRQTHERILVQLATKLMNTS